MNVLSFPFRATLLLGLFSGVVYLAGLGRSGFLERRNFHKEVAELKLDISRLQEENETLQRQEKLLKDPSFALEREARKLYLLSESSKVIKFTESHKDSQILQAGFLPNRHPMDNFTPRSVKNASPKASKSGIPMDIFRIFYTCFSVFLCLGVFLKLKDKHSGKNTPIQSL